MKAEPEAILGSLKVEEDLERGTKTFSHNEGKGHGKGEGDSETNPKDEKDTS